MSWWHRGLTWEPQSSQTIRENANEIGLWILYTWATPRAYVYKRATGASTHQIFAAFPSVSSWSRLFPLCGWRRRSLSSVSGPPTRWRCVRGWLMRTGPRANGHACPGSREYRPGGQQTAQLRALAAGWLFSRNGAWLTTTFCSGVFFPEVHEELTKSLSKITCSPMYPLQWIGTINESPNSW